MLLPSRVTVASSFSIIHTHSSSPPACLTLDLVPYSVLLTLARSRGLAGEAILPSTARDFQRLWLCQVFDFLLFSIVKVGLEIVHWTFLAIVVTAQLI